MLSEKIGMKETFWVGEEGEITVWMESQVVVDIKL
jgi:hypothetical protein